MTETVMSGVIGAVTAIGGLIFLLIRLRDAAVRPLEKQLAAGTARFTRLEERMTAFETTLRTHATEASLHTGGVKADFTALRTNVARIDKQWDQRWDEARAGNLRIAEKLETLKERIIVCEQKIDRRNGNGH